MSDENNAGRLRLKTDMDLDDVAGFAAQRKQAFRIAFDFLNACFPPVRDSEYWVQTMESISHKVEDNPDNPLVKHLLLGVYNYLDEIVKDLPVEETT